ncbi:MAG: 50S ribosomal protein L21 [Bacteroidota bacterium]
MYAIVDIAGKQFKVEKDRFVYAPSLAGEAGASVEFDRVLLIEDDNGVEVGTPTISGARVAGTILEHGRGDKVIVFKKKRRKGFKKKQGHRQGYSKIMIDNILLKGQKASKKAQKKEAPKAEAVYPQAETSSDDLKKISGVGPAFEKALNEHGIHTYQQIIDLTAEEIEKLAEEVDGVTVEIVQGDWVPQAKELEAKKEG